MIYYRKTLSSSGPKLTAVQIKPRGRPPAGYEKLDLTAQVQLAFAILKIIPKDF